MRIQKSQVCLLFLLIAVVTATSCTGGENPVLIKPGASGVSQLSFATHPVARLNPGTGEVWLGAPPGTAIGASLVKLTLPGDVTVTLRALQDGSFIYRFEGDGSSVVLVEWVDPANVRHSSDIQVTEPSYGLKIFQGQAGLYPNRISVTGETAWVVSSGTNTLNSYSLDTLEPVDLTVDLPEYSNPWEAFFTSPTTGIVTTLFGGVFTFDASSDEITKVATAQFRDFASPNGVVVAAGRAWITNPNPISYFPSVLSPGWISIADMAGQPTVTGEINTRWLNPQFVISDGFYVYVSCSGTVDFLLPDYIATAMDEGGIQVIDAQTGVIKASYPLGHAAPGPMGLSPDGRYLYAGSGVAGWLYRIDLEEKRVLNDADNPIVISDSPQTFISFVKVNPDGLLACGSFSDDMIRFVDSRTGEVDPFPFFQPVTLPHSDSEISGVQDAAYCVRDGQQGLLVITTVKSFFHWLPL
jgi:hypothetical protein